MWHSAIAAEETWKLAFGSCNKVEKEQPLWPKIAAHKPDAWLWLGDIVYGDTSDPAVLRGQYKAQAARDDFRAFQAAVPLQLGIYDDHDYGLNDGGREHPIRSEAQTILLDFLNEPVESPRRKQAGAYASYSFGKSPRQIKLIVLDTRYHRDPIGSYGSILGREQWEWLESELTGSAAQIHLIASSIQFVPKEHRFEKWDNFPEDRQRLLDLIGKTSAPGVIVLSGDRHLAELSCLADSSAGYPIYDLTSSGLTHAYTKAGAEPNKFRIGTLYADLNFGLATVDWTKQTVALEVFGLRQELPVIEKTVPMVSLQPK